MHVCLTYVCIYLEVSTYSKYWRALRKMRPCRSRDRSWHTHLNVYIRTLWLSFSLLHLIMHPCKYLHMCFKRGSRPFDYHIIYGLCGVNQMVYVQFEDLRTLKLQFKDSNKIMLHLLKMHTFAKILHLSKKK